jgi:LmbE family N-acetylglucosaminyl deacetylase
MAADLLGATSVLGLDRPDGEVVNDVGLREQLVGLVRKYRPEVVLGPDPTAVFFGGVYVNHRDHRETGWALLDAVAPAAAMPLYFPEKGEAHQVRQLLLSGTHEPDVVVDVSRTIDAKVKAVLAHTSQMAGDPDGIRDVVYGRAEQAGRPVGITFGEAFRSVELAF